MDLTLHPLRQPHCGGFSAARLMLNWEAGRKFPPRPQIAQTRSFGTMLDIAVRTPGGQAAFMVALTAFFEIQPTRRWATEE